MPQHDQLSSQSALVLFSGGQDSTACLAWALEHYAQVETIGFDYGQRHAIELEQRTIILERLAREFPAWGAKLGPDHMLEIPVLGAISQTALTRDTQIILGQSGLPNTFVPGRNLLFFTLAGALAWRRGASALVGGMCETDYSGYPDCRRDTLNALEQSLNLGMELSLRIETPLMYLTKAQTWALAHQLGGQALVNVTIEDTHTCYLGDRTTRHAWGAGCGTCPACELRAAGYSQWRDHSDQAQELSN